MCTAKGRCDKTFFPQIKNDIKIRFIENDRTTVVVAEKKKIILAVYQ